jgi:hypothetical protein
MMKRVVCDETFPILHCNFPGSRAQQHQPSTCSSTRDLTRRTQVEGQSASQQQWYVYYSLPFPYNTPTHTTASMMKDYLDVNFYSIFSEAQNHADKFLVAFLLIKLYHTSHLNIPQYFEETATNSLFRFRFRRLAYQAWPLLAQ